MPILLNRLPVSTQPALLPLTAEPAGPVAAIRPDQIIAWVCLSHQDADAPPSDARRFPVVIDTGCGYPFVLHRTHLDQWLRPAVDGCLQDKLTPGSVYQRPAERFRAAIWMYRNVPGRFDLIDPAAPPVRLDVSDREGIIASEFSDTVPAIVQGRSPVIVARPRPPLLGMPLLKQNNLVLMVDAGRSLAKLRQRV